MLQLLKDIDKLTQDAHYVLAFSDFLDQTFISALKRSFLVVENLGSLRVQCVRNGFHRSQTLNWKMFDHPCAKSGGTNDCEKGNERSDGYEN